MVKSSIPASRRRTANATPASPAPTIATGRCSVAVIVGHLDLLPGEAVEVGEGGGGDAGDGEPSRAVALGGDARVLGQGLAPVERELDGRAVGARELHVLAPEALGHREAVLDVEAPAR